MELVLELCVGAHHLRALRGSQGEVGVPAAPLAGTAGGSVSKNIPAVHGEYVPFSATRSTLPARPLQRQNKTNIITTPKTSIYRFVNHLVIETTIPSFTYNMPTSQLQVS